MSRMCEPVEKSVLEGKSDARFSRHSHTEELVYDLIQEEKLVLIVNRECELAKRIAPRDTDDILEARDETFISSQVRSLRPDDPDSSLSRGT